MAGTANQGASRFAQVKVQGARGVDAARWSRTSNAIGRAQTRRGVNTTGRDTLGGSIVNAAPRALPSAPFVEKFPFKISIITEDKTDYVWIERIPAGGAGTFNDYPIDVREHGTRDVWVEYTQGVDTPRDNSKDAAIGFKEEMEGDKVFVYIEARWLSDESTDPEEFKIVNHPEERDNFEVALSSDDLEFQTVARKLIGVVHKETTNGSTSYTIEQEVRKKLAVNTLIADGGAWVQFEGYEG